MTKRHTFVGALCLTTTLFWSPIAQGSAADDAAHIAEAKTTAYLKVLEANEAIHLALLEGEDTEEKVQFAIDTFASFNASAMDLTPFDGLKPGLRGHEKTELFTDAFDLFTNMAQAHNGMIAALHLMYGEFEGNKIKRNFTFIDLRPCEVAEYKGQDAQDFNRGLKWENLLLKFQMAKQHNTIETKLRRRFEVHQGLKLKKLRGQYEQAAHTVTETTIAFSGIDVLYPGDIPDAPDALDASTADLDTLKRELSDFETEAKAYAKPLTEAKKWQAAYKLITDRYGKLKGERDQIIAEFDKFSDENEDVPATFETLPVLSGNALADLKKQMQAVEEVLKPLRVSLRKAKKWKSATSKDDDEAGADVEGGAGAEGDDGGA